MQVHPFSFKRRQNMVAYLYWHVMPCRTSADPKIRVIRVDNTYDMREFIHIMLNNVKARQVHVYRSFPHEIRVTHEARRTNKYYLYTLHTAGNFNVSSKHMQTLGAHFHIVHIYSFLARLAIMQFLCVRVCVCVSAGTSDALYSQTKTPICFTLMPFLVHNMLTIHIVSTQTQIYSIAMRKAVQLIII